MRTLVLSDTHLADAVGLPLAVLRAAEAADHIVHAGDLSVFDVVEVLRQFAPVTAVHGNIEQGDVFDRVPSTATVELDGVLLAVVHDSGATTGRYERLERQFPSCGVIVYGHSHMPEATRSDSGVWILNPGSPTQKRRAPFHSIAWLETRDGAVVSAEIVDIEA